MNHFFSHKRSDSAWTILMPVLLAGLGGLIYAGIIKAPFVLDDVLILNEPRLAWTTLSVADMAGLTRIAADNVASRVVANLTFALNYYFGGHNVIGYHLFNLAVHIATAWLVFLIARRIMARGHGCSPLAPAAAALLWMVHPLHIQSVTYIWQRMNAMAAMFYLLAFYLYIRGRERQLSAPDKSGGAVPFFAGCALAGLLALGCKQTALTLPLLLIAGEFFFFQKAGLPRLNKQLLRIGMTAAIPAVLVLLYLGSTPLATLLSTYEDKLFTMSERLLTQSRVIIYYLTLLCWPHPARLNLDIDFPLSTGLLTPADTPIALIALIAMVAAVVFTAKKHRLAAFALLWFLVTLIPESSFFGLELIWGYRTYLPSVFIVIALAGLLPDHRRPAPETNGARRHVTGRMALAGMVIVIGIGSLWTFQRNLVWQNDLTLWLDTVRKSPAKARPHHNAGQALLNAGNHTAAVRHYRQALAIKIDTLGSDHPETARTYSNLGVALDQRGDLQPANEAFAGALKIYLGQYGPDHPRTASVYNNLCVLHGRAGNTDRAVHFCKQALEGRLRIFGPDHPETADIYNNLGMAYSDRKEFETAGNYFRKALPVFQRHLGENHPRTVMTRISLQRIQREENKGMKEGKF